MLTNDKGELIESEILGAVDALDQWIRSQGLNHKDTLFLCSTYLGLKLAHITRHIEPEAARLMVRMEGLTHITTVIGSHSDVPVISVEEYESMKGSLPDDSTRH